MYQMTIRGPDGSEVEYSLGPDEGLIVGRDETCDVVLPSKRVSRRHARFFTDGDTLHCEDLSSNGVFVGGARLQGVQEIRPGPPIEIGEFRVRIKKLDPRADKQLQAAVVKAHLKGLGEMAGQKVFLPAERGYVGREPTTDVPVVHDSVSRQHAEVVADAQGLYIVRDLGSSNGTFVNGTRLKPGVDAPLNHDDKVRFGETYWLFVGGPDATGAQLSAGSKRLVLLGVTLVALIAMALFARKALAPPDESGGYDQADEIAATISEAIGRGQAAMDEERFDEAQRSFQEALRADPVHTEARLLLRKAQAELEHSNYYKEARTKLDVGNDQDALDLFLKIEPTSRYFARARLKVQEIAQASVKRDGPACKRAGERQRWTEVLSTCPRYLDYSCHTQRDETAIDYVRRAEKATRATTAWVCPAKLAPWFGTSDSGTDVDKELSTIYPDAPLRQALVAYVSGDLATAQRTASKLKEDGKHPRAAEIYEALVLIEGRVKEGQSALIRDALREAEPPFRMALDADAKLLAGTLVESFTGRQLRSTLAKRYYDIGRSAFDRTRWKEAYDAWAKGLDYSRNDGALLDGMTRLEKIAEKLASGGGCADIATAAHITRPGTPTHGRATAALEEQCQ